jgi:TonB family protein
MLSPQNISILLIAAILSVVSINVCAQTSYINAEPFGGKKEFQRLLKQEMLYPKSALEKEEQGEVALRFIVRENGSMDEFTVEKSISKELDDEAIRLFRMSLWNPATFAGRPRDEFVDLQIKFELKTYKKYCKKRGYTDIVIDQFLISDSTKIYVETELTQAPLPVISTKGLALNDFVSKNLRYPAAAKSQNIFGESIVGFVVEPTGRLTNIHTIKELGGGCNEETKRLLLQLDWSPGMLNGEPVRTKKQFSVRYQLPNSSDYRYIPVDNNAQQ